MIIQASDEKPLVLLVDDVVSNLHILSAILKPYYRIKIATSGEKALEIVQEAELPQLIILDVMMPGLSGLDVLRRLRVDPRTQDIPVIFVSADTSEQSQLDGLDLGADDYLTKPIVTSILLARVRNLLQRKRAEAQLRLAAHVFEYSGEAIMVTDHANRILQVNPAFTRLTGYTLEEISGQNPRILASGRTTPEEYRAMWQSIHERGFWQGEMWDRNKNGSIYPKLLTISVVRNPRGDIEYHIASFADITEQKATEERIRHAAHHDPLTDLPNRLHLQIALQQMLATAHRQGGKLAVMFIDLDRFKLINDTLGHPVGDELLIEVARRLKDCVRESDVLARLGGDEFVIVVLGDTTISRVTRIIADKIIHRLVQPYLIAGHTLHSSPSIGISLYPNDGENIEVLMKNADTAMYHAKSMGRNNYQFFNAKMNQATAERLQLENQLHGALHDGQFVLHYQPQIDLRSGRLLAVEALVRWQHPQRGLIPPDQFIPIAEENGMIVALGDWILETACRQLRAWRDQGQHLNVAVNLSLHQLRHPNLAGQIASVLRRHRLTGNDLELEITESAAMKNPETTIKILRQLRDLGIHLAIDDFGTGYSSLSYLKLLPIDCLKLDRSFVKDIEADPNDATICQATIALAHALGLRVTAEGVETKAQRDFLQRLGCDTIQGYLIAKPLPAEQVFAPDTAWCV